MRKINMMDICGNNSKLKALLLGCIYMASMFSMFRIVGNISLITIFTALFCFLVIAENVKCNAVILSSKKMCTKVVFYLIMLAWASWVWSRYPSVTLSRNYAYTILPIYFICVEASKIDKEDIKIIDSCIMASGLLFFLYALATQGISGLTSGRFAIVEDADQNATCGSLFLILTVTINNLINRIKEQKNVAVTIGIMIVVILLYFLTGSRGGLLALATWIFLMGIRNRKGRFIRIALIGFLVSTVIFVIAPLVLPSSIYSRLFTSDSYMSTVMSEKNRVAIWEYCFKELVPEIKLWGYGAGVPPYLIGSHFGRVARGIHNTYLCMFLEYGVLGLPAFLFFLWSIAKRNLKKGNWSCFCMVIGISIIIFFLESFSRTYLWNVLTYCSVTSLGDNISNGEGEALSNGKGKTYNS